MSSWGTITLSFNEEKKGWDKEVSIPTGLVIDNGVDEKMWLEENQRFYAMSQGRYQHKRFIEHAKDFHDPQFNGVEYAAIADVEDTGDTATVYIYEPVADYFKGRKDGFRRCDTFEGKRFREEERENLKERVENEYGFKPRIEPVEEAIKPDMVFTYVGGEDDRDS